VKVPDNFDTDFVVGYLQLGLSAMSKNAISCPYSLPLTFF